MTTWSEARTRGLLDSLDDFIPAAIELRHALHADPRVSGDEADTLMSVVEALGVETVVTPSGGGVARIGAPTGPAIGLRAELDGLPITEATTVPWRARGDVMHACGHDIHLAALYAVARTLVREGAPDPLVLALQPREEALPSGALDMINEPALLAHDLRAFIGAHVQPQLAGSSFAATAGAVNAAADEFFITMNGTPGHAAYPHLTADPVAAAADLIGTLQHVVSRWVNPMNPTVLTVGSINGGTSPNVTPESVRLTGTLRTFDPADRTRLQSAIVDVSRSVAANHGCETDVDVSPGEPVLINDPALTQAALPWLERAGLEAGPPQRSCGADDFSYYCSRYPSLMVFVGVGTGESDQPGLHHPAFVPPDQTVAAVAKAMMAGYLAACSSLTTESTRGGI